MGCGPEMCAVLGVGRGTLPSSLGKPVTNHGLTARCTEEPILWHQLLKKKAYCQVDRQGGRAQICLCDPGFWDKM